VILWPTPPGAASLPVPMIPGVGVAL